jgi:L-iditol 2-dehydrogenase
MKAALKTLEGTFTIDDVDTPALEGHDWVRARVQAAGICGTDLRHWKEDPSFQCHIMEHELFGEVVEVGTNVQNVRPSDRVVIKPCWATTPVNIAG